VSWAWSIDRPNLAELCERRIDRPVLAAAFIRGLERKSDEWVLALTDGALWWLEIQPGRGVGGWKHWAELTDQVVHIEPKRRGRWLLELCHRNTGELVQGIVFGRAARQLGLAIQEFAPRHTVTR
jgi:hypothetical protein